MKRTNVNNILKMKAEYYQFSWHEHFCQSARWQATNWI